MVLLALVVWRRVDDLTQSPSATQTTCCTQQFRGASSLAQNLCGWSRQLRLAANVTDLFAGCTSCTNTSDPLFGRDPATGLYRRQGPWCENCEVDENGSGGGE